MSGRSRHEQQEKNPPRNYFVLESSELEGEPPQDHDKLLKALRTGAAELEIEVLSPVHVGSGSFGLGESKKGPRIVKAPVTRNGIPVIPGSSIKGACRNAHEILTQSAAPFSEKLSRKQKSLSKSASLFGALGYRGRISFDDAVCPSDREPRRVRLSVPYAPLGGKKAKQVPAEKLGRRFYGPLPREANQPMRIPAHAIPGGTRLRTILRFQNVHDHELGTVFLALGIGLFTPKLGGGKYDRWGWVRFQLRRLRFRKPGRLGGREPWVDDSEEVRRYCREARDEGRSLLPPKGKRGLESLIEKLQAPQDELGGDV